MFLSFFGIFATLVALLLAPFLIGKTFGEGMIYYGAMIVSPWIHSFIFTPGQHESPLNWAYLYDPSSTTPFWLAYVNYAFLFGFLTCIIRFFSSVRLEFGNSSNPFVWILHFLFVHIPATIFACTVMLSLPWVLFLRLFLLDPAVLHPWLQLMLLAPILFACITGIFFSCWTCARTRHLSFQPTATNTRAPSHVRRYRPALTRRAPKQLPRVALKIVQLTDIHLGSWMPTWRARRICQAAVDAQPDLILITGDFLTSDWKLSWNRTFAALSRALEPLSQMGPGRVFACMGNHDYEFPELVPRVLAHVGVQLLRNQEAIISLVPGRPSVPARVDSLTPPTLLSSPAEIVMGPSIKTNPPPSTHATYTVLDTGASSAPGTYTGPDTPIATDMPSAADACVSSPVLGRPVAVAEPKPHGQAVGEEGRVNVQLLGFEYLGHTGDTRRKTINTLLSSMPARSPQGRAASVGYQQAGDAENPHSCVATLAIAHDPWMMECMPKDYGCLMFSGHTHGGQISLQVFGVPGSLIGLVIPDRGPFAYGSNLMYVHGCTGFYGFPLRIGTPSEQGPMHLYIY